MKKFLRKFTAAILAVMMMSSAAVTVQAAEPWQNAYAEVLRNLEKDITEEIWYKEFALRDINADGIPELIFYSSVAGYEIFSFINGGVVKLDILGPKAMIDVSNHPALPGIFVSFTGHYHLNYYTIENNELVSENFYTEDYTYGGEPIITKGRLYNEDIYNNLTLLETHVVNEFNIAKIIFGASLPANPHPFATALRDFFSDATGETAAYLVDVNGDGVDEMFAAKYTNETAPRFEKYRFFYIHNGQLYTHDDEGSYEYGIGITSKNYLATYGDFYGGNIALLKDGKLVMEATSIQNFGGMYFYNGEEISEAEFQVYLNQYGLDEYTDRPDDTARILAMIVDTTNAIKVTVNGKAVNFTNQQPTIVDGRTLVPVRGVFETLGFSVSWNEQARQVTLTKANDKIVITIDSAAFTANGVKHTLDVPAQIIGGSTMLPIRAVLEAVGYSLDWDENSRTVIITTN